MKFKTIYILFNAVILLSFGFIFLMPLLLLGPDYFSLFISKNWIAGTLFLLTLVAINGYFLWNWKLFRLLEAEDWHGLIHYLEGRLQRKGHFGKAAIKMLINAYVVTSNVEKIRELESHLRENKPALLNTYALQLGIPYLLKMKDEPKAAESYFGKAAERKEVPHREWLRWSYASSLLLQRQFDAAKATLLELLDSRLDPVLELLTVHGLSFFSAMDQQVAARVEQERERLSARYTPQQWDRKIESNSKNIQVVLFNGIIRDAKRWLFERSASGAPETGTASTVEPAGGGGASGEGADGPPWDSSGEGKTVH
jgi:hypothetical protein